MPALEDFISRNGIAVLRCSGGPWILEDASRGAPGLRRIFPRNGVLFGCHGQPGLGVYGGSIFPQLKVQV